MILKPICFGLCLASVSIASADIQAPEGEEPENRAGVDPAVAEIKALRAEAAALRAENQRLRELLRLHAPEVAEVELPEPEPTVGDRVDDAVEATGRGLRVAGEKTEEGLQNAAGATGRWLKKVGDKIERAGDGD